MENRYLKEAIQEDLQAKMVLIAGPRQVGKTSLSLQIAGKNGYLNWDIPQDREKILLGEWPPSKHILILDEIHKNPDWRSILKALSDNPHTKRKVLVTGSAKLDAYRRGGDSLQGRYFFHRMHPFTGDELNLKSTDDWKQLLNLGGFPEPYLSGSKRFADRWSRDYRVRLLEDDITSLENVSNLAKLELLGLRLPQLVGSPLSLNSIKEDLGVSHQTVDRWITILDNVYFSYRVAPLGVNRLRTVKKEQKLYLWNWSLPKDPAIQFENMVAGHLLKWIHQRQDAYGEDWNLNYYRDTAGREVDFVLTKDERPELLLEVKLSDTDIHPPLRYLRDRLSPTLPTYQVHLQGKKDYETADGIRVTSFPIFWKEFFS
ncbi:MAG: ATP-binding protein [Leptospira sp.]|nr:ATP-binding protein [Leptospira sp.]